MVNRSVQKKTGMRKGINQLSFPAGTGLVDCMKLAKNFGFEGIEPVIFMSGELSLSTADTQIAEFGKAAGNIGIEITSVCQQQHRYYSVASDRKEIREKAKNSVKRLVDIASMWNVRNVLTVSGAVYLPPISAEEADDFKANFFVGSETIDYDVCYERSVEAFKDLSVYAKQHNVCLGIENIWNWFLLSPLEMRRFIDDIGSENVQVYFDVGNIAAVFGFPEQWIKILSHRIKAIHIKDFRRLVATRYGYVELLSGDVDFPKVMRALKSIGYSGWLTAEIYPRYRDYGLQIVENASASMDNILSM